MANERKEPTLSEKEQEIIAIGASVASGCLPCTKFHLVAASRAGADRGEILQAVRDAARVRIAATEIMARAGGLSPAEAGQPIPDSAEARSVIRELVSIGAAYAINCTTSLEAHLAAARALEATDRQVIAAIEIACGIKDVASRKARTVIGAALGVSEEQAPGCDCAEDDVASTQSCCRSESNPEEN